MLSKFYCIGGYVVFLLERIKNRLLQSYYIKRFEQAGKNVYIGKYCTFTHNTICVGNNVYIGTMSVFQSTHGKIVIGNNVMFGPGVHIHGGNHITDVIGKYMNQVTKELSSDGTTVIEEDVWVGANAIILGAVHIGRGAVIGAGSVITHDVQPYEIVAGVPGKCIKKRFSSAEIELHERTLKEAS